MGVSRILMLLIALTIPVLAAGCEGESDIEIIGDDTTQEESTADDAMDDESMEDEATDEQATDSEDEGMPVDDDAAAQGAAGTLNASVGPGFVISLTNGDGSPVTELAAGTYIIEVEDLAPDHNFHLLGGDVDETTTVAEETTTTWTVELTPGDYEYVCDPHASTMNGSFTVT